MKLSLGRGTVVRAVLILGCTLIVVNQPVHAWMTISTGGREPLDDIGWRKGVVEFANLPSRVSWTHVEGTNGDSFTLKYEGDIEAFNDALTVFAKICAPRLEVVIHDWRGRGPEEREADGELVCWSFLPVNPSLFHTWHNNFRRGRWDPPIPAWPPRIHVYVKEKGPIEWDDVEVPHGIEVIDKRASAAPVRPVGGGLLEGGVYEISSELPIEGASIIPVIDQWNEESESVPVVVTDENGAFKLERIPRRGFHVNAEAERYVPRDTGVYRNAGFTYEKRAVYLARAVTVAGTVIDPDGNPVAGAQVRAHDPIGFDGLPYPMVYEPQPVITDENGRFKVTGLPKGRIHFEILRDSGWFSWSSEPYPAPARDIRLMAWPTGTVRGRVVDSESNPLPPGVWVLLILPGDRIEHFCDRETIGENGTFELGNIPPGKYLLGQDDSGLWDGTDPAAQAVVVKGGRVTEVALVFPTPPDAEPRTGTAGR